MSRIIDYLYCLIYDWRLALRDKNGWRNFEDFRWKLAVRRDMWKHRNHHIVSGNYTIHCEDDEGRECR